MKESEWERERERERERENHIDIHREGMFKMGRHEESDMNINIDKLINGSDLNFHGFVTKYTKYKSTRAIQMKKKKTEKIS